MRNHRAHLKEESQKKEKIHNSLRIRVKMGRTMEMKSIKERLITGE
jgi:hypothetical protein